MAHVSAIDKINKYIDPFKLLEHYNFKRVEQYGDTIRACCKIHGGDNPSSFVYHLERGLWYCHTGDCGGGDAYTLVQKLEPELNFPRAVERVAEICSIDIEGLEIQERKSTYQKELENWIKVTKRKKSKVEHKPFTLDVPLKQVKQFRDFKEETLLHFGLQFTEELPMVTKEGKLLFLKDRLIVPIIQNDKQIGISARKVRAKDFPKWVHLPKGIETGSLLYNIDACKEYTKIVLVEGAFDVWRYYEAGIKNVVCTFGSHITEEQYRQILKTGCDVVFSFDSDDAGKKALEQGKALFKHKVNMWEVSLPLGKDPGSCTPDELREYYNNKGRII